MTKRLVVGVVIGIAWGLLAGGVFGAMFRGLLPAPGEAPLPFAIALVVLYTPFLLAISLETLVGRSSPAFAAVMAVTVASGVALGLLTAGALGSIKRFR